MALGRSDGTSNDMSADIYSLRKPPRRIPFSYLKKDNLLILFIFILPQLYRRQSAGSIFLAEPIADVIAVTTTLLMFSHEAKRYLQKIKIKRRIFKSGVLS